MTLRTLFRLSLPSVAALLCVPAFASYTDTFSNGENAGAWSWGYGDEILTSGGSPGSYLTATVDTVGPTLRTTGTGSPFVGDLRAGGVTGMSVDLKVDHTDFSTGSGDDGFRVTLILSDTKGNFDPTDDDYAYFIGNYIPDTGNGWSHYDFSIDAASTTLPTGWSGGSYDDYQTFRNGVTWDSFIQNVDQVEFTMLTPGYGAIFQNWTIGADNVAVTTAPVPEPATFAALTLGVIGLARKRRNR